MRIEHLLPLISIQSPHEQTNIVLSIAC